MMSAKESITPKNASFQLGLYDESFEKDSCGVGVIANATRPGSHSIVEHGLEILKNLAHRSALSADGLTSDGAGILLQIPDAFFRHELKLSEGKDVLPPPGQYAVAQIFSPLGVGVESTWWSEFSEKALELELRILALRRVPVNSQVLGPQAQEIEPETVQVFLHTASSSTGESEFIQKLYQLRSWSEKKFRRLSGCRDPKTGETLSQFYICSLSTKTLIYKGLMQPKSLGEYFSDLKNPLFQSQFAMVHSRFSTNTLPAWELAQPFRFSCHNGEINTIRGNRRWMLARGYSLTEGRSDSNSFDEALELLLLSGRPLVQSMMMMLPEPWESNPFLKKETRAFYAYQSLRMEPWDGPAALCFTDGQSLGVCLDRNGLRPCRYQILKDGTLIAGSEAGALILPSEQILRKGQLSPGRMLVVDLQTGAIDLQNETKAKVARSENYEAWNQQERLSFEVSEFGSAKFLPAALASSDFWSQCLRFGYHYDEVQQVLLPFYIDKEEAISSMGYDTPLAVLSDRPQLLTHYFRQLFAQVTNPPIDSIREKSVMSLTTYLGSRAWLSDLGSDGKKRWQLKSPLIFSQEMNWLYKWAKEGTASEQPSAVLSTTVLNSLFHLKLVNLEERIADLCLQAEESIRQGAEVLVISDLRADVHNAAIPSLLIVSAVHQHLVRKGLRLSVSLVAETGEARDSHQVACLISFGADAVHPYMVEQMAIQLQNEGAWLQGLSASQAVAHYRQAMDKSLLKIMSKLGISTLQSYCGTQAFEILGLSSEVVETYFPGTTSRIGGLPLSTVAEEVRRRWHSAETLLSPPMKLSEMPSLGDVHYRAEGEFHQWNPETLSQLQLSTWNKDFESFKKFSAEIRKQDRYTLRGQLQIRSSLGAVPIPLIEVEPAQEIVKRFTTGAMSLGALGAEAHETLAVAMNRIGAKSNSGEGGEDAVRFHRQKNGDSKNSAIKQVASGRFGVTAHYLVNAEELQIKMAQGAKPGEGGQLSGPKVDAEIARIRHSTPGVTLISPPPHHDIYSIEDLAQLIFDLQCVNPAARVSVKLVSKAGVGTIAAGVVKAKAQKILISGDGGGTGASALSSIRYAGVPWELGLAETHQTLLMNGLRSKVRLETDGQLRTGRDVAVAALLGADEFGFSTAPLVVEGCLMMRKCHLNTCPVGIATQDPELRKKFRGQPEHLINYFFFVAEELREIMAEAGIRRLDDFIGRTDLLERTPPTDHWKSHSLDLSSLLARVVATERPPSPAKAVPTFDQANGWDSAKTGSAFHSPLPVKNTDRAVGTWLSGKIALQYGAQGLPLNSKDFAVTGSAGQSVGAFLMKGLRLCVTGEANDYVGKGLSGGRLVIRPDPVFEGVASESSLVGNTCLYGATSGELFIAGCAGERFGVRNSGATAVVEGVGNHACEYMTGGCIVILGSTGKNFAAGMSGGLAYVFDESGEFSSRCNMDLIVLEPLSVSEDEAWLFKLLVEHRKETKSEKAKMILDAWTTAKSRFVKVIPKEYQKVLAAKNSRVVSMAEGLLV
jgi:glutamate synthase (NADPH/NADH) large chain/glutamate synthase (ferredoxin)